MPSEDSDAPNSGNQRFSLDDFRLRLDSPMFHRDPGSTEPVQRELPWERSADERATTVPALATIPRLPTFADLIREPAAAQPSVMAQSVAPAETDAPDAPSASRGDLADVEAIAVNLVRAAPEPSVPYTADEVLAELAIKVSSTPPHGIAMVQPVAPSGTPAEPAVRTMPDLTPLSELTPYAEILQAAERAATPAPVAPAPAQASAAAVQAELDRLAYVPDAVEPVAPVVVPAIVVAEPAAGAMPMVSTPAMPVASVAAAQPGVAVPTLSDHEMYMPRAIPQNNVRKNYSDFASALHTPRRRKRHPVRRFFATIVMLSMLGGGLFAAKYYYFDQRWDADVKPLAADVEQARGLEFDHAVDVQNLDGSEYAARLVKSSLGISDDDVATIGGGWRALGLLSGDFDPANVGLAALGDAPAFYDPGAETIYVLRDLPKELHDFAMHRALTLALLDQEFGWWGKAQHSSPAVARGMRAIYDAERVVRGNGAAQRPGAGLDHQPAVQPAYRLPGAQQCGAVCRGGGVTPRCRAAPVLRRHPDRCSGDGGEGRPGHGRRRAGPAPSAERHRRSGVLRVARHVVLVPRAGLTPGRQPGMAGGADLARRRRLLHLRRPLLCVRPRDRRPCWLLGSARCLRSLGCGSARGVADQRGGH